MVHIANIFFQFSICLLCWLICVLTNFKKCMGFSSHKRFLFIHVSLCLFFFHSQKPHPGLKCIYTSFLVVFIVSVLVVKALTHVEFSWFKM